MQKTVNYNLNKPNYSDQYDLRHWNDNMDMIDTQMKAEETARIQNDALKENLSNKVTSFQSTPDDTHYPSEKLVKDYVDDKDDDLREDIRDGDITAYRAKHDDDDNFIRSYYEHVDRKTNSWRTTPDDTHYPSEKLVKDSLDAIKNMLAIKKLTTAFYSLTIQSGDGVLDDFDLNELRYVNLYGAFSASQAHYKRYLRLPTTQNRTYFLMPLDGQKVYYDSSKEEHDLTSSPIAGGNYIGYTMGDQSSGIGTGFLVYRAS